MSRAPIVVLGAGPAGAAAALGLARLGYPVRVVSEWRRFDAVEGVSARVLQGLHHAGLAQAADCALPPCARITRWNGDARTLNHEHLIERRRFDAALRRDLAEAGVAVVEATVRAVQPDGDGHAIRIDTPGGADTLRAAFVVEARGRLAPLARDATRGPQTLSLLNAWQGTPGDAASAVESLPDGWAWMARLPDGRCYWQVTLDVASTTLPPRDALPAWCAARRHTPLARDFFGDCAAAEARVFARTSSATLCADTGGANWLRVGDAAMAVDPLSGNGIFQSLSSALQAPAVIHTLLAHPDRAALALRFHQRRIGALFTRFARIGRDFHALETQWPDRPFWHARRSWPDDVPSHRAPDFDALAIERAPVIDGDTIAEAEVVTSPDQPLGIWHLQGIPLAPIVAALRAQPAAQVLAALAPPQAALVRRWLETQGYPFSRA
ncbi:lycopene cyclase family protein [Burkholderia pseudomultivorans]|uniref:flavin-dependent monooxygenase QhpG n=1 Tax=Burkholderia pseudomultivorans TaxID=1207504 RepID=UPI002874F41D|nr:lycopene cyclase family protein [Burkholderia pseudomultivorans]MDS0857569.1 lycopene cyclase family protein [Burkholderia pseudomultivorans]